MFHNVFKSFVKYTPSSREAYLIFNSALGGHYAVYLVNSVEKGREFIEYHSHDQVCGKKGIIRCGGGYRNKIKLGQRARTTKILTTQ